MVLNILLNQGLKRIEQDDDRDVERQKLRDKYKIAKPVNEDEESEDEDDAFGSVKKKEEDDDAVAREYECFFIQMH